MNGQSDVQYKLSPFRLDAATTPAERQRKIRQWQEGQAVLNAYIQALREQGATEEQIAALREQGATQGFGAAINTAATINAWFEQQKINNDHTNEEDEIQNAIGKPYFSPTFQSPSCSTLSNLRSCYDINITEADLANLEQSLLNIQAGYGFASFFWGAVSVVSGYLAATSTGSIIGIPATPLFATISLVSGLASFAFGYESTAMGSTINYVSSMKDLAHNNGGNINVTYYQLNETFSPPGMIHQYDYDWNGEGFTSFTSWLVTISVLGVP